MENSKSANGQSEMPTLKAIVVQEGTQTGFKVDERETQTLLV